MASVANYQRKLSVTWGYGKQYFTEYTRSKALFYLIAIVYVLCVCLVVVVIEPLVYLPCSQKEEYTKDGPNPFYIDDKCRHTRYARLLFMTKEECIFGRRLVISVILGGIIGWERRTADRPAGIRTMSLVCLGSSLFTICSAYAFLSGPMEWDASRISAAIPSGVGFLGAGLIWKEAQKDEKTGTTSHSVHGLTTAASLWLSAAVGIACGGGLFFAASFTTAIILVLLRFGPRLHDFGADDEEEEAENGDDDDDVDDEEKCDEFLEEPLINKKLDEEMGVNAINKTEITYGSTLTSTSPQNSGTVANAMSPLRTTGTACGDVSVGSVSTADGKGGKVQRKSSGKGLKRSMSSGLHKRRPQLDD